jgi:hypothetical protein
MTMTAPKFRGPSGDDRASPLAADGASEEALVGIAAAARYHAPALRLTLVREAPGTYRGRVSIRTPESAAAAVREVLGSLAQERFVVLLLDVKLRLLGVLNVSEGSLTSCSADPKVIFSSALLAGASQIVLAHSVPGHRMRLLWPPRKCCRPPALLARRQSAEASSRSTVHPVRSKGAAT